MLKSFLKRTAKKMFMLGGYDIRHVGKSADLNPGGVDRPIGNMLSLLEDLKARGVNPGYILDVGANIGYWSRMAKSVFPSAHILMIEPLTEVEKELEAFCKEFQGSRYYRCGAGAKEDELLLTVWDDLVGSSFIPGEDREMQAAGKQRRIRIRTIDEILESDKLPVPGLIKLDIQGFELEALKGAGRTFGTTEVYILECTLIHPDPNIPLVYDVMKFMAERNYVPYDFPGFLRRPADGALGQCDICFVRRDGPLRQHLGWE